VEICPKCGLPTQACVCDQIAKTQQRIEVKVEKRRFGKMSTMISGFDAGVDIKEIAKRLKEKRACGGTVKNGIIELQGNHRGHIKSVLVELGFTEEQIKE
jgi:translation initiation factor 1